MRRSFHHSFDETQKWKAPQDGDLLLQELCVRVRASEQPSNDPFERELCNLLSNLHITPLRATGAVRARPNVCQTQIISPHETLLSVFDVTPPVDDRSVIDVSPAHLRPTWTDGRPEEYTRVTQMIK